MSDEPHSEKRDRVPPIVFEIATWLVFGVISAICIVVLVVMVCANTGNLWLTSKPKPVEAPPIQQPAEPLIDN